MRRGGCILSNQARKDEVNKLVGGLLQEGLEYDRERNFGLNGLLTDEQYAAMKRGEWDADDVPAVDPVPDHENRFANFNITIPPYPGYQPRYPETGRFEWPEELADKPPLPLALGIALGFLLGFIASALLLTT